MSNWLQRWWEYSLGLPVAEPGQVSRWSWAVRLPWPSWLPPVFGWLVVAGLVLLIIGVYRRDAQTLSIRQRAVLIGLRSVTVMLVLLMLAQISLSIERAGLPLVVVLIDDSASMGLRDAYTTDTERQFVTALMGSNSTSGSADAERFELARRILSREAKSNVPS